MIILAWNTLFNDFYHMEYTEDGIKNFLDNNKDVVSGDLPSPSEMVEYSVQNFISMANNTNTVVSSDYQTVTDSISVLLNKSNYSWVFYVIVAIILFNIIKNTIIRVLSLFLLIGLGFLIYYLYKEGVFI